MECINIMPGKNSPTVASSHHRSMDGWKGGRSEGGEEGCGKEGLEGERILDRSVFGWD